MKVTYDQETDPLYIEFRSINAGEAHCQELTDEITLDEGDLEDA